MSFRAFGIYELCRLLFTVAMCLAVCVFLKHTAVVLCGYIAYRYLPALWTNWMTSQIDTNGRGVFITGCDSGLGHAFAKHLDQAGFHVFAGCYEEHGEGARKLKQDCSERATIIPIDVTNDVSIQQAFELVKSKLPKNGLWGIINNAGLDTDGEVEFVPISLYEKIFGVNLYGHIRVTKQFLPLVRQTEGRVVNITSVRGRLREPRQCCYSSSKHMTEKLSDALRLEMKKFGVKVVIVEPGNFGHCTSIGNDIMVRRKAEEVQLMWDLALPEVKKAYGKSYVTSWTDAAITRGWQSKSDVMRPVSNVIEQALRSKFPNARYQVDGYGSTVTYADVHAIIARVYHAFPSWITDFIMSTWKGSDEMK